MPVIGRRSEPCGVIVVEFAPKCNNFSGALLNMMISCHALRVTIKFQSITVYVN